MDGISLSIFYISQRILKHRNENKCLTWRKRPCLLWKKHLGLTLTNNFRSYTAVMVGWNTRCPPCCGDPEHGCMNGYITGIMGFWVQMNRCTHGWMRDLRVMQKRE